MSTANKVILVGNLGKDPECRTLTNGSMVANVSLATSERFKRDGQPVEETEWHRVVFMDRGNYKMGEIASKYLKKGTKVYVEGRLKTHSWQDKEKDVKRSQTQIIANEFKMLDSKDTQTASNEPQTKQSEDKKQETGNLAKSMGFDDFDEDIPF